MDSGYIILGVLGAVVLLFIVLYNRLIALRQTRKNAFSDIDVQLKLRYNLVPQLIEVVKGYVKHEKELLEKVTEARAGAMKAEGTADRAQAEGVLGSAMMNLFAVAENYPDLRANESFNKMHDELSDIENKIAAARRFFNNATSEYNTAREQFPAIIIANMFNFGEEEFFEMPEAEAEAASKPAEIKF